MLAFWLLAALMTVVALAIVLVPMLRARAVAGPSAHEAALEVLRGQRREIDADIAAGTLPAEAREEALAELIERAHADLDAPAKGAKGAGPVANAGRPWLVAGVVAVAIPALAFGLYAAIGTPSASDPKTLAAARAPVGDAQIVGMVENLARKVRERPDDAQGWALLSRSMAALGRFAEAAEAYEHLARLAPGDAQVLADWADALGMAQGRVLRGRPAQIVQQALKADPKHPKALALAATAALESEDYAGAIGYWNRVGAELGPDSRDAAQVATIVAEIRGRATAAGRPLPEARSPARLAAAPTASGKTISGSVAIAPSIASQVKGDETLFIFARAEGGPRVPLAVMRASARALPLTYALDDSQAMAPGMNLSSAQSVRVEARISRSGNATPQPGDLIGTSVVVKPGARDVRVVVDKVLP